LTVLNSCRVFEFRETSTSFLIDTSGVGGGVLSNIVQATFEPGVNVGTPRG
jgi:hypothetical protein